MSKTLRTNEESVSRVLTTKRGNTNASIAVVEDYDPSAGVMLIKSLARCLRPEIYDINAQTIEILAECDKFLGETQTATEQQRAKAERIAALKAELSMLERSA